MRFDVHVGPMENIAGLLGEVPGDPMWTHTAFKVDGEIGFEGAGTFPVALEPGEQRRVHLLIQVTKLQTGRFAPFAVTQAIGDYRVGGLAVAVTP
ncbi:hypothetical protein Ssi02_01240 [Sinosporangium siamense]|uniref:Uncharacterized protein n=2 Tax=Sinosporangium siamense TaxID=1367973 RepID=A0A919R9M5_9ACTN|nr:hypothetical protein Ssi02_01240 [Sinosporangium siamense]